MKLRELFDSLSEEEQKLLVYYLDRDEDHHVPLTLKDYEGAVFGVFLERDLEITVILSDGPWGYGRPRQK